MEGIPNCPSILGPPQLPSAAGQQQQGGGMLSNIKQETLSTISFTFDSGFQSAATSQTPSIIEREEDDNVLNQVNSPNIIGGYGSWDDGNFITSLDSLDIDSSLNPSVPMFTDTYDDSMDLSPDLMDTGSSCPPPPQTTLTLPPQVPTPRLNDGPPPPYQMMDSSPSPVTIETAAAASSSSSSAAREISADTASKAIPTLIDLLKDDDPVVLNRATNMVLQLSKEKGSRDAVSDSPGIVVALLEAMSKAEDIEMIENGAGVLYNLSEYRQGRLAIYKFGGIVELVKLLSFTQEELVVFHAITALHNLLLHQEGSKAAVRSAHGLQKMVALLSSTNEKFLSIVTDCLHLLAYGDPETKLVIYRLGGTLELIQILRTYNYSNLLWTTCRTLKVLSVCPENKRAIVENGGMQALAMHLNRSVDPLVFNCLWTIRNLSDAAINQDSLDILLRKLLDILNYTLNDDVPSNHINTITCVAGILSNLTCNNPNNKQIVWQHKGVEILVRTIIELHTNEDITEPAVCALRHLTCRYSGAEMAQNAVRVHQGIGPIVNLLISKSWPLRKAVIGLLRNLALCQANIAPLRDHLVIQKLSDLLNEAFQCMNRINDIPGASNITTTAFVNNVKVETIIEGAVATLQILAKDSHNRELIRNLEITPILLQLTLNTDHDNLKKVVYGILTELAKSELVNEPEADEEIFQHFFQY